MKRILLTLAALVLSATSLFAQTFPCDAPAPNAATFAPGGTQTFLACLPDQPTALSGWAIYDGTVRMPVTMVADTVVSPTNGRQYSTSMAAPTSPGVHTYTIAAINSAGVEGPKSVPFVLTVSLPVAVPPAPTKFQLRQP